jgi:6-phosphogluconate dehydrogenase
MMAGGSLEAYRTLQPVLEVIAAKDMNGKPCVTHTGTDGAGHFVKMVHNGIEYAEMQLLAEVYALLRVHRDNEAIAEILQHWNETELSGYLLNITIDILRFKEDNHYLIDSILDKASNKGTGGWSAGTAIDSGVPATMMTQALFARYLSGLKDLRKTISKDRASKPEPVDIEALKEAYKFARLINHYQGFDLIAKASMAYDWNIDLAETARVWTNGCIIKSELMHLMNERFLSNKEFWTDEAIVSGIYGTEESVKKIIRYGIEQRTALPCFSDALQFWFGLTTGNSPANLTQAQRDYFGGHTYRRFDSDDDHSTNWKPNG